jgi:hypothetical protein
MHIDEWGGVTNRLLIICPFTEVPYLQVHLNLPLITRGNKNRDSLICFNKLDCCGKYIIFYYVSLGCCGVSLSLRHRQPPSKKHTFLTVQAHAQALSRARISAAYRSVCKLMTVVYSLHKSDGNYTGTWLPFFPVYFRQYLEF